jgi:hypothetical protein
MPLQDHHSLLKAALDIEHVPISPLKCLLKFHRKVTLKKFLLSFISTKTLAYEDSGTARSQARKRTFSAIKPSKALHMATSATSLLTPNYSHIWPTLNMIRELIKVHSNP